MTYWSMCTFLALSFNISVMFMTHSTLWCTLWITSHNKFCHTMMYFGIMSNSQIIWCHMLIDAFTVARFQKFTLMNIVMVLNKCTIVVCMSPCPNIPHYVLWMWNLSHIASCIMELCHTYWCDILLNYFIFIIDILTSFWLHLVWLW